MIIVPDHLRNYIDYVLLDIMYFVNGDFAEEYFVKFFYKKYSAYLKTGFSFTFDNTLVNS